MVNIRIIECSVAVKPANLWCFLFCFSDCIFVWKKVSCDSYCITARVTNCFAVVNHWTMSWEKWNSWFSLLKWREQMKSNFSKSNVLFTYLLSFWMHAGSFFLFGGDFFFSSKMFCFWMVHVLLFIVVGLRVHESFLYVYVMRCKYCVMWYVVYSYILFHSNS
jgi:hypothetical protein